MTVVLRYPNVDLEIVACSSLKDMGLLLDGEVAQRWDCHQPGCPQCGERRAKALEQERRTAARILDEDRKRWLREVTDE